jgi:hypothetical protein
MRHGDETGSRCRALLASAKRRSVRVRRTVISLMVVAALVGCARVAPPGGGPADATPPEVLGTTPEPGAIGVDRNTPISFEFSEEMNRESAERAFTITPDTELRNLRWSGRRLWTEPTEVLPDSTTFIVQIAPGARDYHGVNMAAPFSFAFSTGSHLDDGTLTGRVTALGEPVSNAVVWVCPGAVETDTLGFVSPCGYTTRSGEDGGFRVDHVGTSESAYAVVAFIDRDLNGRFSPSAETGWVVVNAAFVRAPGDSVGGIEVRIIAPEGVTPEGAAPERAAPRQDAPKGGERP